MRSALQGSLLASACRVLACGVSASGVLACGHPSPEVAPGDHGPKGDSRAAAPSAPAPSPPSLAAPTGLAARVCPPGPWGAFPRGELRATLVPGSRPTDLDPKDTEFHLYEGPVWTGDALLFSDFRTTEGFPSRILRYSPDEGVSVVLPDSGTNGLALDSGGEHLLGARHSSKSVVRFSADYAEVEELAVTFEGRRFNSPNDLVMRSDGSVYFTDPSFQAGNRRELEATGVYWVAPGGAVHLVDADIQNPNGITLSPDEEFLFVAGNMEQGYVKRYPLGPDGSVGPGAVILSGVTIPDGMVVDCAGHLYVTEHTNRRVRVITPDGEEIARIVGFEANVTNVAFGGPERRTLYVTLTAGVASIELPIPGLPY